VKLADIRRQRAVTTIAESIDDDQGRQNLSVPEAGQVAL
jgi:hypothetical protein